MKIGSLVFTVSLLSIPPATLPASAGETKPEKPGPPGVLPREKESTPGEIQGGLRESFREFLEDGRYLLSFPSRPTRKGVALSASVLGATGLLLTRDESIRDWVEENRSNAADTMERIFEPIGRPESGFAITAGAYLLGRLTHRRKLQETSALAFESYLYTGAITALAKGFFAREGSRDPDSTGQFWEGGDIFPSGHTSRSFAVAAVFAESYGRKGAWVAYPIAALVGLARIESSDHWASDVLAGAALGVTIGKALSRRRLREPGRPPREPTARGPAGLSIPIPLPGGGKPPGGGPVPEERKECGMSPGPQEPT